ncbi:MAG: 50S ribosomal protein L18Ae [Candidatus Micrarchaeota archaeon]
MKYVINGTMEINPAPRSFSMTIEAKNEKLAVERIYAEMGSKHGLTRRKVKVLKVEQAK